MLDQTNAINRHEEAPRTCLPHLDSRPCFLPLLPCFLTARATAVHCILQHPLSTQASSPANQPAISVARVRFRNETTGCQRDKVLEDKDKSMLLQIWSKMSCSGILSDFSICSGIEELIYLLHGAPRGRPHGPSRPPAGSRPPPPHPGRSSARRPPTPHLCRPELSPGMDWVKREMRRKQGRRK